MALIALLFAHHGGTGGEPPAMHRVAGSGVIERQIRQVRGLGAGRVIVIVERMPPRLAATLAGEGVEVRRASDAIAFDPDDHILVIEDALIVDRRLVAAISRRPDLTVAVWRGRTGPSGAQRIDPTTHWAGVALYPASLVSAVLADLGDWDLQETLLRAAFTDGKPARIDAASLDRHVADLRRDVPLAWFPIRDTESARAASRQLFADARRDPRWRNLPDTLVHPILDRFHKGRGIRLAEIACHLLTIVAFAAGYVLIGILFGLGASAIHGLNQMLVRFTGGQLMRGERLATEALFQARYLALAAFFIPAHGSAAPLALSLLIILASLAARSQAHAFRRLTGRHLDTQGIFERRLELLGANPANELVILLATGVIAGWWAGLAAVAFYASATWVLTHWRFFVRFAGYARAHAPAIAANLESTAGTDAGKSEVTLSA